MLFDDLAGQISKTLEGLRGSKTITENNVGAALREVRRSLLEADVNLRVVNTLVQEVKEKALGAAIVEGVDPGQQFIKIMYDELVNILGNEAAPLTEKPAGELSITLLAGLQGAGKTTAAAKLAKYVRGKMQKKVLLVAADVYRPAAVQQLQTLGSRIEVEVFTVPDETDSVKVAKAGVQYARDNGFDVAIVDTQGRQVVDDVLMEELVQTEKAVKPDDVLLVVDAMTGQQAAEIAKSFNEKVSLSGTILTKLDGDTRGGAALSILGVSGKPIKFCGVGEKMDDLEVFYPDRMASRILGMGDVLTFVEKAQTQMDAKEAEEMTKKMKESKFDFDDFLKQSKMVANMGNVQGMLSMMPGMAGKMSDAQIMEAQRKLRKSEELINCMTVEERSTPELLIKDKTAIQRMQRIADDSGNTLTEVRNFVGEFQGMRVMMRRMGNQMDKEGDAAAQPEDNRQARRAAKKKAKSKLGAARGFGAN